MVGMVEKTQLIPSADVAAYPSFDNAQNSPPPNARSTHLYEAGNVLVVQVNPSGDVW
jgi:hypothetical protein